MKIEYSANNTKEDQEMMKKMNKINYKLVDKLLKLYIERCKLTHSLAFLQFRSFLPYAEFDQEVIKEAWESQFRYLKRCLNAALDYRFVADDQSLELPD